MGAGSAGQPSPCPLPAGDGICRRRAASVVTLSSRLDARLRGNNGCRTSTTRTPATRRWARTSASGSTSDASRPKPIGACGRSTSDNPPPGGLMGMTGPVAPRLGAIAPTGFPPTRAGRQEWRKHGLSYKNSGGRRAAQGRASSNAADARSNVVSPPGCPISMRPTGRPPFVKPHGRLAAGRPVRFACRQNGV